MPYSYTLSTVIPASPAEIYQAWLDSILHAEMTGGEANMSDQVGADVSAWDGYIIGRNLELVPGERIVQSWRTTEFDDAFEDSIVTILLRETEEGTLLTLEHSNVPEAHRGYEEGGWTHRRTLEVVLVKSASRTWPAIPWSGDPQGPNPKADARRKWSRRGSNP